MHIIYIKRYCKYRHFLIVRNQSWA